MAVVRISWSDLFRRHLGLDTACGHGGLAAGRNTSPAHQSPAALTPTDRRPGRSDRSAQVAPPSPGWLIEHRHGRPPLPGSELNDGAPGRRGGGLSAMGIEQ